MTLPLPTAAYVAWSSANLSKPDFTAPAGTTDAVVKLSIKAIDNARTADTLGAEREGTGIVIGDDGLILTIGYLIIEASSILAVTADGRVYPATPVGFDHATGFGLVRADRRIAARPLPLGESARLHDGQPLGVITFASGGGESAAHLVSTRRFTGYWEYMIDGALFTAPPRFGHSGAALVTLDGELVGVGSLWVADALDVDVAFPGNMFAPIDLLKPIMAELLEMGRRRSASRPWLGVYTEQVRGHVVVTRVLSDSPAEVAGLKRGDILLGVAGEVIVNQAEFYERLWRAGAAGIEVQLHLMRSNAVRSIKVPSIDRIDYFRGR